MFSVEMVRCLNKRRLFTKPSSGLLLVLLVCIHLFASYYQYTYQFPFDMDSQPSAKRERKANLSNVEVRVLLDVYRQHQVRLNAKFSSVITHRLKTALWLEVATAVSACGHSTRPVSMRSLDEAGQQEVDRPQEGSTQSQSRGKLAKDWGTAHGRTPWFTETVLDVLGYDTTLKLKVSTTNDYNIIPCRC